MKRITALLSLLGTQLYAQSVIIENIKIFETPEAKLLYPSDKGLVYALPQDNMKCLVPYIQFNMPVAKAKSYGFIPNSMLRPGQKPVQIIPLNTPTVPVPKEDNFQYSKPETNSPENE